MLLNGDSASSNQAPHPPSASVKLRRRNRQQSSSTPDAGKKKNRHSGDFFHWSPSRQLQEERRALRKSGDWSYVGFPDGPRNTVSVVGSQALTPNKRPSPITEDPPPPAAFRKQLAAGSVLESKVISSIIQHNENSLGNSRSAHNSPIKPASGGGGRCTSAMETLDRKPEFGNGPLTSSNPASSGVSRRRINAGGEEHYSMLQPRSLLLTHEQPHSSFYMNPMADEYATGTGSSVKTQRTQSQSRDATNEETTKATAADVSLSPRGTRRQKGLGRRSATQTEISRKNQWVEEDENEFPGSVAQSAKVRRGRDAGGARGRWKSTEHVNEMPSSSNFDLSNGLFSLQIQPQSGEPVTAVNGPSLSSSTIPAASSSGVPLRKGLMWQQRDRIFSRWKERYFVLTRDYLQCFKKGSSRISEMGGFIFKIRLAEVEEVELLDKRGYLTISLTVARDGKILLRKPEGIREWCAALKDCAGECRNRSSSMKSAEDFWSRKKFADPSTSAAAAVMPEGDRQLDHWLLGRQQRMGYLNGGGGPISSASAALLSPNRNCGGGIGRSTDDYISLPPPQAMSSAAMAAPGMNSRSRAPFRGYGSPLLMSPSGGGGGGGGGATHSAPSSRPHSRARTPSKPRRNANFNDGNNYTSSAAGGGADSGIGLSPQVGSREATSAGAASSSSQSSSATSSSQSPHPQQSSFTTDSGNDSLHTNTSTGGSTDSSNHRRQRSGAGGGHLGAVERDSGGGKSRFMNRLKNGSRNVDLGFDDDDDDDVNEDDEGGFESPRFRGRASSEAHQQQRSRSKHQQNRRSTNLQPQSTRV